MKERRRKKTKRNMLYRHNIIGVHWHGKKLNSNWGKICQDKQNMFKKHIKIKLTLKYHPIAKKTNLLLGKEDGLNKTCRCVIHITFIKIPNIDEESCHTPSLSTTTVILFRKSSLKGIQDYLKLSSNKISENNDIKLNSELCW